MRNTQAHRVKKEIMEYIGVQLCHDDGWKDDAEVIIYYFASQWHGGQTSALYSILSTSPFNPGSTSLESEDESIQGLVEDLGTVAKQKGWLV